MIDLNLLATLGILLQTKSVSRTAQRLGLSQPTVSRSLGRLRKLLSDPLLVRSGGGMELTYRATELAKPLDQWLALTSTMLEPKHFDPSVLDRRFRVASTDFGVLSVLSPALGRIRRAAPACRIDISAFSGDMFQRLATSELDLIVSGLQPDLSIVHARYLFSETFSIVLHADHPLAREHGGHALPIETYLRWPHIALAVGEPGFDYVDACLGDRAADRRLLTRLPYFYAAPELIGASQALLTMPTRAARKFASDCGFHCMPAPVEIADFQYWALWHERSARDPAVLWLINILAEAG